MTNADVSPQREETKNDSTTNDTLVHAVARTVGATLGTIASGTAKILGTSAGLTDKMLNNQSRLSEDTRLSSRNRISEQADRYKRKRARHKQKLRRSHTSG